MGNGVVGKVYLHKGEALTWNPYLPYKKQGTMALVYSPSLVEGDRGIPSDDWQGVLQNCTLQVLQETLLKKKKGGGWVGRTARG